jgi:hypothetical protein
LSVLWHEPQYKPSLLWKGTWFLLHYWHPSCYSCYKPGDKSWMRKGPGR